MAGWMVARSTAETAVNLRLDSASVLDALRDPGGALTRVVAELAA